MEQHPIPQNISSFQFKLIGDITLKQFAYVAGGIILAYLTYRFTIIPGLLRLPLALVVALFGFALAFFPVEERPLDRWLISFIKSIYMPTQFVWKKQNQVPDVLLESAVPIQPPPVVVPTPHAAPVSSVVVPNAPGPVTPPKPQPQPKPARPIDAPPLTPLKPIPPPKPKNETWTIGAPPVTPSKTVISSAPTRSVTGQRVELEEKKPAPTTLPDTKQVEKLKTDYQELEKKLTAQMQTMQQELQKGNVTQERFTELQQLLSQMLTEKERMSKELIELRKQLETKTNQSTIKPTTYKTLDTATSVKIVPPTIAKQVGVPQLTTYPNIVTGIVKDSSGNLLPSIILTVKDRDGLPVRALKTNRIGQFAASTPLANGTYIIEVEDPKKTYQFDRIEVSLSNQILPPLEISAISQKDRSRQQLAKEIFGQNNI